MSQPRLCVGWLSRTWEKRWTREMSEKYLNLFWRHWSLSVMKRISLRNSWTFRGIPEEVAEGPDTLVEVCPLWTMWSKSFQASPKPYLFGVGYYFFPVRCHATKTLRQELPMEDSPSKECHILMSSGVCSTAMEMGILTSFGWTKWPPMSCERTADGLDCSRHL